MPVRAPMRATQRRNVRPRTEGEVLRAMASGMERSGCVRCLPRHKRARVCPVLEENVWLRAHQHVARRFVVLAA